MKRIRFIAPARREFLSEVAYYNEKEVGLGSRFAAAIEEAAARAVAFPLLVLLPQRVRVAYSSGAFHSLLYIVRMPTVSSSLLLPIILDDRSIGSRVSRIADNFTLLIPAQQQ